MSNVPAMARRCTQKIPAKGMETRDVYMNVYINKYMIIEVIMCLTCVKYIFCMEGAVPLKSTTSGYYTRWKSDRLSYIGISTKPTDIFDAPLSVCATLQNHTFWTLRALSKTVFAKNLR
jgi:hypothetical protein